MSSATPDGTNTPKYRFIRAKIILNLLKDLTRIHPDDQDLAHVLTLGSIIPFFEKSSVAEGTQDETQPGALAETDVKRFTPAPKLDSSTQRHLVEQLDSIILSIFDFFHGECELTEEERHNQIVNLPEGIQARHDELASDQLELVKSYDRIQSIVTEIASIYPLLDDELTSAISTFPGILNAQRSASADLLAATIETSLIRLALLRARAHHSLYGYKSLAAPQASMARALSAAYEKLKKEERKMEEEERAVDHQLNEYQRLLQLVDGSGGGFAQVVDDWMRVQKESEECKRDLRRMGWTGD